MPILYVANDRYTLAYVLDPGGQDYCRLETKTAVDGGYASILYGLSEYFNKWSKELDAQQYKGDERVGSPADHTVRPKPDAVEIRTHSHIVYNTLVYFSHKYILYLSPEDKKLRNNIKSILSNIEHRFTLIPVEENKARRLIQ